MLKKISPFHQCFPFALLTPNLRLQYVPFVRSQLLPRGFASSYRLSLSPTHCLSVSQSHKLKITAAHPSPADWLLVPPNQIIHYLQTPYPESRLFHNEIPEQYRFLLHTHFSASGLCLDTLCLSSLRGLPRDSSFLPTCTCTAWLVLFWMCLLYIERLSMANK